MEPSAIQSQRGVWSQQHTPLPGDKGQGRHSDPQGRAGGGREALMVWQGLSASGARDQPLSMAGAKHGAVSGD